MRYRTLIFVQGNINVYNVQNWTWLGLKTNYRHKTSRICLKVNIPVSFPSLLSFNIISDRPHARSHSWGEEGGEGGHDNRPRRSRLTRQTVANDPFNFGGGEGNEDGWEGRSPKTQNNRVLLFRSKTCSWRVQGSFRAGKLYLVILKHCRVALWSEVDSRGKIFLLQ